MNTAGKQSTKTIHEADAREELIDTYELFTGLFKELEAQHSYTFKLDSTLPLIYGKPLILRHLFSQFISSSLNALEAEEYPKTVLISHTKDRLYWIFNLQILNDGTETNQTQKLLIHKGSIQNIYSNTTYQLNAS